MQILVGGWSFQLLPPQSQSNEPSSELLDVWEGSESTGAGIGLQSGSLLRVGIEAVEPARGAEGWGS